MIAKTLEYKLIIKISIGICLWLTFILVYSASAAPSPSLPASITVEMYQLDSDGSLASPLTSCNYQNDDVLGCTAIPNELAFNYPYGNDSTPDVDLEDYVLDVLSIEMKPTIWTEPAALKAQAVASRSYASWHHYNGVSLNNSTQRQVFMPFAFEDLNPGAVNDGPKTCSSSNRNAAQHLACNAVADRYFIAQAQSNPSNYPAKALFNADVELQTGDGTFDKPYLASVQDPISGECDADDEDGPYGMSQQGANRWARGHECSFSNAQVVGNNGPGEAWSVHWEQADQILFHYYTSVHLRDADNNDNQLSPSYRWNPLEMSGSNGCFPTIPLGQSCTVTFEVQNTGTQTWSPGTVQLSHHNWEAINRTSTSGGAATGSLASTVEPGDPATVSMTLYPPSGAQRGDRYRLAFDMQYIAGFPNIIWFSEWEVGRPWPRYEVTVCIESCLVYIPLVLKD